VSGCDTITASDSDILASPLPEPFPADLTRFLEGFSSSRKFPDFTIYGMAIQSRCPCGHEHVYSDGLLNKRMRCPACKQFIIVTGDRIANPGKIPWSKRILVVAIPLLVPLAVIGFFIKSDREKFHQAWEEYDNGSREPFEPTDEVRIRALLHSLVEACREMDANSFAACFHPRRMLAEIEARGGYPAIHRRSQEEDIADDLSETLRSTCVQMSETKTSWQSVKRCTVRFLEGRGEAEAYATLRRPDSLARYRFWLVKEKKEWLIFDFKSLGLGIRLSSSYAKILGKRAQDDRFIQGLDSAFESFHRGAVLVASGNYEQALEAFRKSTFTQIPGILQPSVELGEAIALEGLGRFEEALQKIDQAIQHRKDMTDALHVRGRLLCELEHFEDSLRVQEEYLRIAGPDPDTYVWMAHAYVHLNRWENLLTFLEEALTAAPDIADELEAHPGFEEFRAQPDVAALLKRFRRRQG
jgi:tetratricopeptide (TPR) repeat protein